MIGEYFKDSKARDRVENLLTLYHGTGNNFNVFDISTLGKGQKNAGNFGDGFYFTPNKNIANQYAKNDNIKEVYVDIKNPFIYTQLNEINGENTFSDYVGIYNLVNLNQEWGDIPVKYGSKQTWNDIKNAVETYIKNGEDIYNIDEKLYSEFGDLPEQTLNDRIYTYSKNNGYKTFREVLQEKGYDGIFSDDAQSDNTQYVAFEPNQIKNVDNQNPTEDPDIRYSKKTTDKTGTTYRNFIDNMFDFGEQGTTTEPRQILPTQRQSKTKSNTINQKVNEYIKNVGDFKSDINIDSNVINKNDLAPVNYLNANQGTLKNKAKELFKQIGRKVFKNQNEQIYVTNTDISKSIENTLKEKEQNKYLKENLAVFSQLDKVIENAKEISSSEFDYKKRDKYSNYKYYVSNAYIDGNPYVVEFDTRLQEGETGKKERPQGRKVRS